MHLIVGGAWQGKKEYARRKYHIEESDIWSGGYPVPDGEWKCINGLHNIIREMMQQPHAIGEKGETIEKSILQHIRNIIDSNPDIILICDEVGSGIVPVDKAERDYRECVGRVLCELAGEADSVERVHCGIGQVIKHTVNAVFIRHGATESNLEKRYISATDDPLCAEGITKLINKKREGAFPEMRRVVVSPMSRCIRTAEILYPNTEYEGEEAFRETDFGIFENKNYGELMADETCREKYQAWIDSGGRMPFPGGESMEQSAARCAKAFERLLPTLREDTAFVVHGGTIMGILSTYVTPHKDYYDYQCGNGEGYLCRVELTGDGMMYRMTIQKLLK